VVIQGLAEHKDTLGAPLCPCRHYDDKAAEAAQGFWNCPCVPMRERKVRRQPAGGGGAAAAGVA
jgi:ferredoxin-thioredoxin reductase catalytic chain